MLYETFEPPQAVIVDGRETEASTLVINKTTAVDRVPTGGTDIVSRPVRV